MRARRLAPVLCSMLLGLTACGDLEPKAQGEPCFASSECDTGLTCDFGVDPPVCSTGQSGEVPSSTTPDAAPAPDAAAGQTPDAAPGGPDATPEPPDATPEPPDATPEPPDATPEPPDATPEPPDATPEPPDATA